MLSFFDGSANGGRDELTLDDWRALFKNVTQLEFIDYKK